MSGADPHATPDRAAELLEARREWYRTRCGLTLEGVRPLTSCYREKGHEGPHGDAAFEAGIQYARRATRS